MVRFLCCGRKKSSDQEMEAEEEENEEVGQPQEITTESIVALKASEEDSPEAIQNLLEQQAGSLSPEEYGDPTDANLEPDNELISGRYVTDENVAQPNDAEQSDGTGASESELNGLRTSQDGGPYSSGSGGGSQDSSGSPEQLNAQEGQSELDREDVPKTRTGSETMEEQKQGETSFLQATKLFINVLGGNDASPCNYCNHEREAESQSVLEWAEDIIIELVDKALAAIGVIPGEPC